MDTIETNSRALKGVLIAAACAVSLGLSACEKQGPLEQAGEEVDEAVDTVQNDGEEPASNKVDDAVDELRE